MLRKILLLRILTLLLGWLMPLSAIAQEPCELCCNPFDSLPCPKGETCYFPEEGSGWGTCECFEDRECPHPMTCDSGQCAGPKSRGEVCRTNYDCGRGLLCAVGVCRTRCTRENCSWGERCLNVSDQKEKVCLCVQSPCPSGSSNSSSCSETNPCRAPFACVKTQERSDCFLPCPSGTCAGGEACVQISARYVCACSDTAPCPTGLVCSGKLCHLAGSIRCDLYTPCPEKTVCIFSQTGAIGGFCRPRCQRTADCREGTPCKEIQRTWVCGCTTDRDCKEGSRCLQNTCVVVKTSSPEPLPSPKDASSTDAQPIEQLRCDPPCPYPQRCVDGQCKKLLPRDPCTLENDCASGFCFSPDHRLPICSVRDCEQCASFGLVCVEGKGEKGCFFPPYVPPQIPEQNITSGCQCNQSPLGFEPFAIFFLFLVALLRRRRAKALSATS
jgi:hypothetical protein